MPCWVSRDCMRACMGCIKVASIGAGHSGLRYGQSLTDGRSGWDDTVAGLEGLANAERLAPADRTANIDAIPFWSQNGSIFTLWRRYGYTFHQRCSGYLGGSPAATRGSQPSFAAR